MTDDTRLFIARWFSHVPRGSYLATAHNAGEGAYVPGYRSADGPVPRHGKRSGWDMDLPCVYVSPQPCTYIRDGYQQWSGVQVDDLWYFVALDIDLKDLVKLDLTMADIWRRVGQLRLPPAWAVVNSGSGGVHIYWALDKPMVGLRRHSPDNSVQGIQVALQGLLHADMARASSDRPSLRLPGTVNVKPGRDDRLCTLDHSRSTWRTCSTSDFDGLPKQMAFEVDGLGGYGVHTDLADWEVQVLGALGSTPVNRNRQGTTSGYGLDKCPGCNRTGPAYVTKGTPHTLRCHKPSCDYHRGIALSALAKDLGITSDDVEIETIDRANIEYPNYFDGDRGDITGEIVKGLDHFFGNVGYVGYKGLSLVQMGMGGGKDTTLMPRLDREWLSGLRKVALSVHSFDDACRKRDEWYDKDKHGCKAPLRIICSPLSLEIEGQKCTQPKRLTVLSNAGFAASRGCGDAKSKDKCPDFDTCKVRVGHVDHNPHDLDVKPLPVIVHTRWMHTDYVASQGLDGLVIDEQFAELQTMAVSADELRAWAKALMSHDVVDGISKWSECADVVVRLADSVEHSGIPAVGLYRPVLDDLPVVDVPQAWPVLAPGSKTKYLWPGHIDKVVRGVIGGKLTTIMDGLLQISYSPMDSLPASVLLMSASAVLYKDMFVHHCQSQGRDLQVFGGPLQYKALYQWRQMPMSRSHMYVKGRGDTRKKTLHTLHLTVAEAVSEWHDVQKTGGKRCRVLVVSHKNLVEGRSAKRWAGKMHMSVDIDMADWHSAIGTNRWEGQVDIVVLFGDPNMQGPGEAELYAELYKTTKETIMRIRSEHWLMQSAARCRPKLLCEWKDGQPVPWIIAVTSKQPVSFPSFDTDILESIEADLATMVRRNVGRVMSRLVRKTHTKSDSLGYSVSAIMKKLKGNAMWLEVGKVLTNTDTINEHILYNYSATVLNTSKDNTSIKSIVVNGSRQGQRQEVLLQSTHAVLNILKALLELDSVSCPGHMTMTGICKDIPTPDTWELPDARCALDKECFDSAWSFVQRMFGTSASAWTSAERQVFLASAQTVGLAEAIHRYFAY